MSTKKSAAKQNEPKESTEQTPVLTPEPTSPPPEATKPEETQTPDSLPESTTPAEQPSTLPAQEPPSPAPEPITPTLEQLHQELEALKQVVADLQVTVARKRRPPATNGKVQIKDKTTGTVYPSKNNAYQTLLKAGELKTLVDKGVFGPVPEKNTFGWYVLVREWPDRFEEVG